ncbi:hypothetical protein T552_01870 [Pneumocystis carinii B80]|uniref:Dynamin-type G domain-containing protein n=1 Tax=Pneumocystis carinii (strain B80) TaxID=1408658 RepID=A0A0W4ZI07_PNEC8|nr:hypothetical protein T552_01870 [Pneumocystis carinii B80]KTW28006.1 hypothetical protein T552_01870 [Pneumocystis carinii B80]
MDLKIYSSNILSELFLKSPDYFQEHYQQLLYNNSKLQLLQYAERTKKLLSDLIKFNNKKEWVIHYPLSNKNDKFYETNRKNSKGNETEKKINLSLKKIDSKHIHLTNSLSFKNTSNNSNIIIENIEQKKHNFKPFLSKLNILKLQLKLGEITSVELSQLEKSTIALLLNKKIIENIKHIETLMERIENKSSKILITGDLNSGKSTFCNALLKQKILPEDQQPCTEIFCEIIDSYKNSGKEEVHAIPHGMIYDKENSNTYAILRIHDLNKIVIDSKTWSYIKIYINNVNSNNQNILRNDTLDITLIDSPGLNFNSMITTAVFSKQEEIDIIIFVVNAENHFTLSAKEFILNASNEKALLFIVVNKFDNVKDKERCKDVILKQIFNLSPQTYYNASELVHFVNSASVTENDKIFNNNDFEKLEKDLKIFILEKRIKSKLSPGKTYLLNLLTDIKILCETNKYEAIFQIQNLKEELKLITPICKQIIEEKKKILNEVKKIIENVCLLTSRYSYEHLSTAIMKMEYIEPCNYQGFFKAYSYAINTKRNMLNYIELCLNDTETFARINTSKGINEINNLRMIHIKPFKKIFQPQYMFSKHKNIIKNSVYVDIDLFDFIDFNQKKHTFITIIGACSILGGKIAGYHNIITTIFNAFNIIGTKNLKKLIIPFISLAVISTCGYAIFNIPKAIPKKIAKKIKQKLENSDFINQNSLRIISECQKVLKYPQKDLHLLFQKTIKKHYSRKEEILKNCKISKHANDFFTKLSLQAEQKCKELNSIDIDNYISNNNNNNNKH